MGVTGHKGLDIRQSGNRLIADALLLDSAGDVVTSGTTSLFIYELQDDGTIKSYDFNDNTFKSTALTTPSASMTHRTGNNGATNTGIWTYVLSTLTGFTSAALYYFVVTNTNASPPRQTRKFQYGDGVLADFRLYKGSTPADLADTDKLPVSVQHDGIGALIDWLDGGRLDLLLDLILEDTGITLPASLTSIANAITALNNLSALANIFGPPVLEIPDSGSTAFAFTMTVKDQEGKLVALDSSPTLTVVNAGGTDRSSYASAVSNPATGRYTWTITIPDDAPAEGLKIEAAGTVSADARFATWNGAVVDYDSVTTIDQMYAILSHGTYGNAAIKTAVDGKANAGDQMDLTTAALAKFANTDTGETSAVAGSVAKIAQGAADTAAIVAQTTAAVVAALSGRGVSTFGPMSGSKLTLFGGASYNADTGKISLVKQAGEVWPDGSVYNGLKMVIVAGGTEIEGGTGTWVYESGTDQQADFEVESTDTEAFQAAWQENAEYRFIAYRSDDTSKRKVLRAGTLRMIDAHWID